MLSDFLVFLFTYLCEIFKNICTLLQHMRMATARDDPIHFQKMKPDTYLFEDLPQYHLHGSGAFW